MVPKDILKKNERSLLDFWDARRAGRVMPKRTDINPEDLFPWIGYLHLLEPVDGGHDFRYAVFTTRTIIGADNDMTGKRVSDWGDERVVQAMRLYGAVLEQGRPIYNAVPERHENDWIVYSRICLPLGTAEGVTHILAMLTRVKEKLHEPIYPAAIDL